MPIFVPASPRGSLWALPRQRNRHAINDNSAPQRKKEGELSLTLSIGEV
jgi:hypothetical protein